MRCPACRQVIEEVSPACAACGFSLAALEMHLGIPPQLQPPIADVARVLRAGERKSILRALEQIELLFPDLHALVVVDHVPANLTPEIHTFWLFNRCGLFSPAEKGGRNHGVLLLLDPKGDHCSVMLGYGLEPLLPQQALESALNAAQAGLKRAQIVEAAVSFYRELSLQLEQCARKWPESYGYTEAMPWFDSITGRVEKPTVVQSDRY